MKILVTGFDPFGGEKVNPAYEAVKLLPDTIAGAQIIKIEIPTVFARSGPTVEAAIKEHNPDVVINVGQAGGRSCVTIERVAINLAEARIPDNDGESPMNQLLQADGEPAYFATIPVNAIVENVRSHGLPCFMSYTAGTYVCNQLLYAALDWAQKNDCAAKTGFVHLPWLPVQVLDRPGQPSMELDTMVRGIQAVLEAALETEEGENNGSGTENP